MTETSQLRAECRRLQLPARGRPCLPKGGKARLLSLEDWDRRRASYRKTAELIDRVEADLGGADRPLDCGEADRPACGADRRHAGRSRYSVAGRCTNRSSTVLCNFERRLYETVGRVPREVTQSAWSAARGLSH